MTPPTRTLLPNIRLMARAFHRVPVSPNNTTSLQPSISRGTVAFSTSSTSMKWEGRPTEENANEGRDDNNVQFDAAKQGKSDRAASTGKGGDQSSGSSATSEKAHGGKEKAREDHPKAPGPIIGMEDERGGKQGT